MAKFTFLLSPIHYCICNLICFTQNVVILNNEINLIKCFMSFSYDSTTDTNYQYIGNPEFVQSLAEQQIKMVRFIFS